VAARVGAEEALAAGRWLRENVGPPADVALVMGSGLSVLRLESAEVEVAYRAIPHWRVGDVAGHAQILVLSRLRGCRVAVLCGRVHEYEGFELSEVQLPVRSLAAWGVRKLVLTSAGGAVDKELSPGTIVVATKVLDLQYRSPDGTPVLLEATGAGLPEAVRNRYAGHTWLRTGIHASVPGPQYETPAELSALWRAGVTTVSMTPAAELRAAHEEGLDAAVVTVVTNAGDTTHSDVLQASKLAKRSLTQLVTALIEAWALDP
jgi:purine nucleoside phosphorylase